VSHLGLKEYAATRTKLLHEITDMWQPARYFRSNLTTSSYEQLIAEGVIEEEEHRLGRFRTRTIMVRKAQP